MLLEPQEETEEEEVQDSASSLTVWKSNSIPNIQILEKKRILEFLKSINRYTYLATGITLLITVVWIIPNWKNTPATKETTNPLKSFVELPAFDESSLYKDKISEIDIANQNITYFLNEEKQRGRIQMALVFLSIASDKVVKKECTTQLGCLESLSKQRILDLQNLIQQNEFEKGISPTNKNVLLQPVAAQVGIIEEIEAWRLAIILAKPNDVRTPYEKWEISTRYKLLESGIPAETLTSRPAILMTLLGNLEKKKTSLIAKNPEEQARYELQQKLCADKDLCNMKK